MNCMFCDLVFFDRNDFQRNPSLHQKHQTGFPRTLLETLSITEFATIAVPFGLYRIFTLTLQNLSSLRTKIV